jgi:hypothetical protein
MIFAGDDFWCTDPAGDPNGTYWLQGCHMVHCAYNSLWMGNFIQPDWDMFQSHHACSEFHAASRAISGGPIYVSDSVGNHNFKLLKKLVLPDGSILRCQHYALPTRDSLFVDPLHDGKTMLKIWNLNKVRHNTTYSVNSILQIYEITILNILCLSICSSERLFKSICISFIDSMDDYYSDILMERLN